MSNKKILISQPKPINKSPYFDIEKRYNVSFDFHKFFELEGVHSRELRKQRLDIGRFTGIIFTSKIAVDHFFRVTEELRYTVPPTLKYYCNNESIAQYLSKYVTYRKRKISFADGTIDDFVSIISKSTEEVILLPVADNHRNTLYNKLKRRKLNIHKAVFYNTVNSDLSKLNLDYDIIVLFSPAGVKSLVENFPEIKDYKFQIAAFGTTTAKAVTKAGLKTFIKAPTTEFPSMAMAIEKHIRDEEFNQ